jgi:regulator of nonsense transcripts 1
LYHQIDRNLIRTDELPDNKLAMERLLEGSEIILSTLSSLSNPSLDQGEAFELVPVERLVVDEASQINIFEYMVCPTLF